ncbi:GGDEF domain-containing protein [Aestuariicella hydrocarbonica]|uniref:diguanylate cyclase n=1 Tax=Pseudomaricurvus hydrocarbonicus TaxID=1470433 RepID=A0A9E5JX82_9GAMM|nr:GGDEF domain-containing protein [Aestuariicella hydrocarbonica]NHO66964.1 GGDEF domain-containing protein [Aestuariicella hydrocarbonica]
MQNYLNSQQLLSRPYRQAVLKALLIITIISGLLFTVLNLGRQNYSLAFAELLMSIYSMAILWLLSTTDFVKHIEIWALVYLVPFFSVMMLALASPGATASVFVWVFLIPILSHFTLGKRLGLMISVCYIAMAGVIFFNKYQADLELLGPVPVANFSILTLVILAFSSAYEITREQTELRLLKMAHSDPLTGLANRAHLHSVFEHEQRRSERAQSPLCIALLDLDHFKRVNDTYGHEVGDMALVHVAEVLKAGLRKSDLVARLGGEEFCLLLMETQGQQGLAVADKIRRRLEQTPVMFEGAPLVIDGTVITLTISGGVAEHGVDGTALKDLIRVADQRLYESKNNGRNQIRLHSDAASALEVDDKSPGLLF